MLTPKATPIRAAIFDMDGVLTDSEPLIRAAAMAMFKEKGLLVQPEDFTPFVGMGENRFIGGVAEKYNFPLEILDAKRRTYEFYLQFVPTQLEVFPGAVDLVRACRRSGLKLAVASSADRIKVVANLNKIGLPPESWDVIVTAEDVVARKPAPDIFLAAAARLNVNPAECVVVEDAVSGVAAAKAAQMRCVAVAQTFAPEKLSGADLVRARIADISVTDLTGDRTATNPQNGSPPPVLVLPPAIGSRLDLPPPIPSKGLARPWGFWATMGFSAVIGVAFILSQAAVLVFWIGIHRLIGRQTPREDPSGNGLLLSLAVVVSAPVAAALSWVFAQLRVRKQAAGPVGGPTDASSATSSAREYLGLKGLDAAALLKWALLLIVIVVASDALTWALGRPIVPEFMERTYATAGFLPLLWFAFIVGAPVAEETLFRGFMFTGLLHSRVRAPGAILITALLWSLTHQQYDVYGIATIFVAGVFLGLVRYKTGSIYATMFLHGLMNFIATLETEWMFRFSHHGL